MKNDFICQSYIEDETLCDEIIQYHDKHAFKEPGKMGRGVNPDIKLSTDSCLNDNLTLYMRYCPEIMRLIEEYATVCPEINDQAWVISEKINVQHYKPNEAYFGWHSEMSGKTYTEMKRYMAFMTYLNDVDDGGETEFKYQNLKVKPQKGLMMLWPAGFTHTHRGIPSETQDKYIITGWISLDDSRK